MSTLLIALISSIAAVTSTAAAVSAAVPEKEWTFLPSSSGNDVYQRYSMWAAPTAGRIELTFKTSQSNSTLLYIAGLGHHVQLSLVNGRLDCSAQLSTFLMHQTANQRWNDDKWHKVVLIHRLGNIQVKIDGILQAQLRDHTTLLLETSSAPLYIGGVPFSQEHQSFRGCMRNIKVANFTLWPFHARYVSPLDQNGTVNGACNQPCSADSCSAEEQCVGNWSNGNVICTCSPLLTATNCGESLLGNPFLLNGTSYQCYSAVTIMEPYIPSLLTVNIHSPIPANGVLLTLHGYGQSPHQYSAVLYLENYKPYYTVSSDITSTIGINITLSPTGSRYKISVLRDGPRVKFIVEGRDEKRTENATLDKFIENEKELVCIGGSGYAGIDLYKGSVSATQDGLRLTSSAVAIRPVTSLYLPTDGPIYLWGSRKMFSKDRHLTFKVWMKEPGNLIHIENSRRNVSINIRLQERGIIVSTSGSEAHSCHSRNIKKEQWMSFSIRLLFENDTSSPVGLTVSIDNHVQCTVTGSKWLIALKHLLQATVIIGKPLINSSFMFSGHIENVTLDNKETSLNIEPVVKLFMEEIFKGDQVSDSLQPTDSHKTPSMSPKIIYLCPDHINSPRGISTQDNSPFHSTETITGTHGGRDKDKEFLFTSLGIAVMIGVLITGALSVTAWYMFRTFSTKHKKKGVRLEEKEHGSLMSSGDIVIIGSMDSIVQDAHI